jgi:outer membrane protein assembly factor BamA
LDPDDNVGRFINNTSLLHSYDSATLQNDKAHAGVIADFTYDGRNSTIFPSYGKYINFQAQGYAGLNHYSKSYLQLTGVFAFYKSIDRKSNIIFSNRTGGGYTVGNSTFYQSLFLGGHTNLQGYHQFRYSGEHMLYNNSELRIKLANLASYILPGQLGLVGFYDIGKVWQSGYNTSAWHQGFGGGLYFAPAGLFVFQLVAGKSDEGWYPYFTAGVRF